jgi:flagellar biosynthesis GTPase FlhF
MKFNVVHLAYAVMIFGCVMTFVLSKNKKKEVRKASDAFAFPFAKLSNYIAPTAPAARLAVEELGDGKVRALPVEEQPEPIRFIMKRANTQKSVDLFAELVAAEEMVAKAAGRSRFDKREFLLPINQLLMMTHTFLVGCENLATITTQEQREQFDSYLQDQVKHRMVLLKRIQGFSGDEYAKLNKVYADEMEKAELEEREAKRNRQAAKEQEKAEKQAAREKREAEKKAAEQAAAREQQAAAQEQNAAEKTEESDRDKWRGWGCG